MTKLSSWSTSSNHNPSTSLSFSLPITLTLTLTMISHSPLTTVSYSHIEFAACSDAKSALSGALLIVTCTGAKEPLFNGEDVEEGAHINVIGSHFPEYVIH